MKNQKKISFPSNLHGHTTYCDGKNRAEEYILAAIEKNFVSVGLSGHSYVYFDKEPNMSLEGTLKYIEELKFKFILELKQIFILDLIQNWIKI